MTTIRVRAYVPEDRQVTLTLPDDVPVGEADLEVTVKTTDEQPVFDVVLPPDNRPREFPNRPTNPELAAEHDSFERMLPELMKQYAGKYVAFRDGMVVAVGDSEVGTLTEAYRSRPGALAYVRLVTEQPLPIPRIGSPRLLPAGG
jgi:hypothetical protein